MEKLPTLMVVGIVRRWFSYRVKVTAINGPGDEIDLVTGPRVWLRSRARKIAQQVVDQLLDEGYLVADVLDDNVSYWARITGRSA